MFLDARQPAQSSHFLMITGVGVQGYRGCFFGSELSCKDRIEGFFNWLYSVVFCIIIIREMIYAPPFWLYAPPFWLYTPLFLFNFYNVKRRPPCPPLGAPHIISIVIGPEAVLPVISHVLRASRRNWIVMVSSRAFTGVFL